MTGIDDVQHTHPTGRMSRATGIPEPQPVDGCRDCAGHAARRDTAYARDDLTAIIDQNVLLRRHIADAH